MSHIALASVTDYKDCPLGSLALCLQVLFGHRSASHLHAGLDTLGAAFTNAHKEWVGKYPHFLPSVLVIVSKQVFRVMTCPLTPLLLAPCLSLSLLPPPHNKQRRETLIRHLDWTRDRPEEGFRQKIHHVKKSWRWERAWHA